MSDIKAEIFNAYKPLDAQTNKADDLFVLDDQHLLIDGDMMINQKSKLGRKLIRSMKNRRTKRKIKKKLYDDGYSARWPLNTVPYEFDPNILKNPSFMATILQSINYWESSTCIQFEPFNPITHSLTHRSKLVINLAPNGCYSDVGYPDEDLIPNGTAIVPTSMFLSYGCVFGQIGMCLFVSSKSFYFADLFVPSADSLQVHEIGHIIGFYHEQSRSDRDNYVTILWQNIIGQASFMVNFFSAADEIEPNNLNVPYDLSSIMHYESTAFGYNGQQTIVSKDPNLSFLMGNRAGFSFYDIKIVTLGYNCSKNCINPPKCQNDGFLMANCTCKCPTGVTGSSCETFIALSQQNGTPLANLSLNCTFQIGLCGWTQEQFRDETDFTRTSGPTLAQTYRGNTGPTSDRFQNPQNFYLYLNTYYMKYPSESAMLTTPTIQTGNNSNVCISFWYNMNGDQTTTIGNLSLFLIDSYAPNTLVPLWSRSGPQGSQWLYAAVCRTIVGSNYRIVFKAQRVTAFFGDIAIDDVQVSNVGPVNMSSNNTQPTTNTVSITTTKTTSTATTATTNTSTTSSSGAINGGWSAWSDWDNCTKCAIQNGILFRYRYCDNPLPSNGGLSCNGFTYDYKFCSYFPQCRVDGNWSAWSNFSDCSPSCLIGIKTRYRTCTNPAPQYAGRPCAGSDVDFEICNASDCVPTATSRMCPSCTSWSATWSPCDRYCGPNFSTQVKYRTCSQLDVENNCMTTTRRNCTIACSFQSVSKVCTTVADSGTCLPQMDGQWSSWDPWEPCSVQCGNGTQTRRRYCTNPEPLNGGKNCTGQQTATRSCYIDCNSCWSPWSDWSSCSVSCGFGYQTQTQSSVSLPCTGKKYQYTSCWAGPCIIPVLSDWTPWTVCAQDCSATAFRYRFRTCLNSMLFRNNNCNVQLVDRAPCLNETVAVCTDDTLLVSVNATQSLVDELDGGWSTWSAWTTCCGVYTTRVRMRTCESPYGCSGNATESDDCQQYCNYTPWSPCSVTCDAVGFSSRQKLCTVEQCNQTFILACAANTSCDSQMSTNSATAIYWKRQANQPACGGLHTISTGSVVSISSPNYPNNYGLNLECSYIVNTVPNRTLSIQITDLDIESTNFNLCPDSLEIRYNALGQMGVRICGTISKIFTTNSPYNGNLTYTSYSNTVLLYFRSDWLVTRRGFQVDVTGL